MKPCKVCGANLRDPFNEYEEAEDFICFFCSEWASVFYQG